MKKAEFRITNRYTGAGACDYVEARGGAYSFIPVHGWSETLKAPNGEAVQIGYFYNANIAQWVATELKTGLRINWEASRRLKDARASITPETLQKCIKYCATESGRGLIRARER